MSGSPESAASWEATLLLPDLRGGGAEKVAARLAEALAPRRVGILLFGDERDYATTAEVRSLHRRLELAEGGRTRKAAALLRAARALRRERRRARLGVVVSFLTLPNLLNALTRARGERVVLSEHTDLAHDLRGPAAPLLEALMRRLYPRADRIVTVSEGIRRDLVDRFGLPPEKVVTIHNPVDLEAIDAGARAPLLPAHEALFDRPSLLTVGRLTPPKGQWHLLRVLAQLRDAGHRPRLLLAGDGELRATLDARARALGHRVAHLDRGEDATAADVVFLGFVANPYALMARASAFVLPSIWEGFGLVLVEAMRSGAPVLAADCPSGPREILAPDTDPGERTRGVLEARHGVLLPAFDEAMRDGDEPATEVERAWAGALARLLDDPDARAALAASGMARTRDFEASAQAAQWGEVIFGEAVR